MLSIVIPALDEGAALGELVGWLDRQQGVEEILIVDASDSPFVSPETCQRTTTLVARDRGRAIQMNQGAGASSAPAILFLHADSRPPIGFADLIERALDTHHWGRFDIRLDHPARRFRVVETMINLRSRARRLATGDQGIFVRRSLFEELGGFAEIPLMEDVEFSRRAGALSPPGLIEEKMLTSARRWLRHGTTRTILLMWKLRYLYWRGANPADLATMYRNAR